MMGMCGARLRMRLAIGCVNSGASMMTTASGSAATAASAVRAHARDDARQPRQDRHRPHDGDVGERKLRCEPLALHLLAADAQVVHPALAARIERGHEPAAERVARMLAGDEEEAQVRAARAARRPAVGGRAPGARAVCRSRLMTSPQQGASTARNRPSRSASCGCAARTTRGRRVADEQRRPQAPRRAAATHHVRHIGLPRPGPPTPDRRASAPPAPLAQAAGARHAAPPRPRRSPPRARGRDRRPRRGSRARGASAGKSSAAFGCIGTLRALPGARRPKRSRCACQSGAAACACGAGVSRKPCTKSPPHPQR